MILILVCHHDEKLLSTPQIATRCHFRNFRDSRKFAAEDFALGVGWPIARRGGLFANCFPLSPCHPERSPGDVRSPAKLKDPENLSLSHAASRRSHAAKRSVRMVVNLPQDDRFQWVWTLIEDSCLERKTFGYSQSVSATPPSSPSSSSFETELITQLKNQLGQTLIRLQ